jgi:hypothetical protein
MGGTQPHFFIQLLTNIFNEKLIYFTEKDKKFT